LVKNEKALIRLNFCLNMRVIKSNIHLIWNVWKNYSFSPSWSPVDTTVLVIWSVLRFWRTPFTISPRNCST
jgi:hypothetical protein